MMATTGPPNRPAMHSTTERASKITPGIKTRGINMPTTQMPPNSTPETICPIRGFCRQSRMLTPCKKHSASNSATPLISSRNMGFRLGGREAHHPGEATFCKRNSCARRSVVAAGARGASLGATVVIVTHELASIYAIATNSVFLDSEARTMLAVGDPKRLVQECEDPTVINFLTRGTGKREVRTV